MSCKKTGGPAFPLAVTTGSVYVDRGMTLRDWFAGQALAGMLGDSIRSANMCMNIGNDLSEAEMSARWAYMLADAILAERDR